MCVCGLDSTGLGQGQMEYSCEHDNKRLDSTKGREFLYQLSNYWVLEK